MKIRITLIIALVALSCVAVNAQDSQEIERTYRKQADVYLIGEALWMTPSFSENGQVCMMRVYPRAISENTNFLDPYLNASAVLTFINASFPLNTRGRRRDGFGMSDSGGGVVWTHFGYDYVRFVFVSSIGQPDLSKLDKSTIGLDFPVDEAGVAESRKREEAKSDDQIIRERIFHARVLEIYWPNRKCAKL